MSVLLASIACIDITDFAIFEAQAQYDAFDGATGR